MIAPLPFGDLRRLEKERLMMLPEDWRLSKLLYNMFSVQSVEPVNILTTTNNTTAINLVAENMGFTFLQESGIRRTPYMDRLVLLHRWGAPPHLPHGPGVQEKRLPLPRRPHFHEPHQGLLPAVRPGLRPDRPVTASFPPQKIPILSRRCAAEKSSLRSLNALPCKAFRAFDPTRGGLPPPSSFPAKT